MKEKFTGKGQTMTMKRVFDAPLDRVWEAWTDPELLRKWWGPRHFDNPTCEWDARPGGKINVVMTADGSPELGSFKDMKAPMGGYFKEIVKREKLVFISTALGTNDEVMLENLNTVTFRDKGGKTEIIINVEVLDVKPAMMQALEGMGQGWSESLDKLVELLK
ncbi:MAG: SRPBCC domain-containing protein [Patescibacteria group bacterium]|nr:SRPBCC domain-containing protein [Patescibacteria group bacterium]